MMAELDFDKLYAERFKNWSPSKKHSSSYTNTLQKLSRAIVAGNYTTRRAKNVDCFVEGVCTDGVMPIEKDELTFQAIKVGTMVAYLRKVLAEHKKKGTPTDWNFACGIFWFYSNSIDRIGRYDIDLDKEAPDSKKHSAAKRRRTTDKVSDGMTYRTSHCALLVVSYDHFISAARTNYFLQICAHAVCTVLIAVRW